MRYPCEHVGMDFFDSAPTRYTATELVNTTPEQVFDAFLDAVAWTKWVWAITKVEWTSPHPVEVGSTRTVHMRGGIVGYEEFIAWEPGRRMAFRFNEASMDTIKRFAEDYRVTDLGDGRCVVDWVMAMDTGQASRRGAAVTEKLMAAFIRHTLRRFRRYVEARA